ncbi:MAG: HNH endonuclease signature motif containing protein, partial [Candidatus Jordarchaeaceae archaeon]
MVHSKYLESLTPQERSELENNLYERQGHLCFICEEKIDPQLSECEIDHVVPLASGEGKDEPNNFALCHKKCNREKQD